MPNSSSSPNNLECCSRELPLNLTMTKTPNLLITSNCAWSCGWHHTKHGLNLFHGATPTTSSSLVWSHVFRLKIQNHFGLMHTKFNGKNSETTTGKRKTKLRIINFHNPPRFVKFNWFFLFFFFGHLHLRMYLQMHEMDKLLFHVLNN